MLSSVRPVDQALCRNRDTIAIQSLWRGCDSSTARRRRDLCARTGCRSLRYHPGRHQSLGRYREPQRLVAVPLLNLETCDNRAVAFGHGPGEQDISLAGGSGRQNWGVLETEGQEYRFYCP